MATILLADEIVSDEIFEDNKLEIEDIKEYFTQDVDEAKRIYNSILEWFNQNINRFYYDTPITIGEVWGRYNKIDDEITNIYVVPKILKDFLADNNISFNGIKTKLFDKGYIEKNNSGEYTVSTRVNTNICRCIKIIVKTKTFDLEDNQQEMYDLPF